MSLMGRMIFLSVFSDVGTQQETCCLATLNLNLAMGLSLGVLKALNNVDP